MDGNGRWARKRGLPRVAGHRAGIDSVRDILEVSAEMELEYLTLWAFSVENWKRPPREINTLMQLLEHYIVQELSNLMKNNIRFNVVGQLDGLPGSVQDKLRTAMQETSVNTGLHFNVALNYSGRTELIDTIRRICRAVEQKTIAPVDIDEKLISNYLFTTGQPDPDLLIRTSGEMRISNFFLWQLAYSEIWVTEVLWPNFRREHFFQAIGEFQKRDRRFGGVQSGS
jgi:undecaprenyl diphosphate synthase